VHQGCLIAPCIVIAILYKLHGKSKLLGMYNQLNDVPNDHNFVTAMAKIIGA